MNNYLAFIHSGIEAYSGEAQKDGVKLADDCLKKLKALDPEQFPPRLLILFTSPAYQDQTKASYLLFGINQTFSEYGYPGLPLVGCSSGAVFFNQQIYEGGALLICLASRLLTAEVAVSDNAVESPKQAVDQLLEQPQFKLDQNQGGHPDPFANQTLLTFFPGFNDDRYAAPDLHRLMRQQLSARIPIIGGAACTDDPKKIKPGLQFAGNRDYKAYSEALVAARITCETPIGLTFTSGLAETGRLLRVSSLSQDRRAINEFFEGPAAEVIEREDAKGKVALLAEVSIDDYSAIYIPRKTEGDPYIRVSREVNPDACFMVMRPDAQLMHDSLRNTIQRTTQLLHLKNPTACLALMCNGLLRYRHKIKLSIEDEFKNIERSLNNRRNDFSPTCVGAFVDGEAGVDENGRSVFRNWGTATMIAGDELRNPAVVYRGFAELAEIAKKRFAEPEEAVTELLEMIYQIGFNGAMISYLIQDETADAIIAQKANGSRYPKIVEQTRRLVNGNDILALVARERRPRFVSDSRLLESNCDAEAVKVSGVISQYIHPLMTISGDVYGILQIDLGDLSYKRELNAHEKHALEGIGVMVSSMLLRTFHWKEGKIIRELDQALKDCISSKSRDEGLKKYLEKVLAVFGLKSGQIRLARIERNDLVLVAGVGPYHEASKVWRRRIDFGDISPTARAFREDEPVIVNNAPENPAHKKLCSYWKDKDENLSEAMKEIRSYANLPFRNESGESGTIDLIAGSLWFFARYHVKVLKALGDRVVFLLDSLKRKSREELVSKAVPQLSEVTGFDKPDEMLRNAITKFASTMNAERASLFLWDEETEMYILRAQSGWADPDWIHAAKYQSTDQWAGIVALHGSARHIYDLATYYKDRGWPEAGGNYNVEIFGERLSPSFTVEVIGLPLYLAEKHLGALMLYRRITPGQSTGFLTVDTESLREASDKLSGVIELLQLSIREVRREAESKRRGQVYDAIIAKDEEEDFETFICSQIIHSYDAGSVDLYLDDQGKADHNLSWKLGIYRDSDQTKLRSSLPQSGGWVEEVARNYGRLLNNKVKFEVQVKRLQLTERDRKTKAFAKTEGTITRMCLPLISESRLVGVMDIKWPHRRGVYSLDYDFDRHEMLTLGRTIGSQHHRNQIIEEKKSALAQQKLAIDLSIKAGIKQREAEMMQTDANKRQQDAVQLTTAYVLQNAHRLVNEVVDLRVFPMDFRQAKNSKEHDGIISELDNAIKQIEKTATWIFNMGGRIAEPVRERCCLKDILNASLSQIKRYLPKKYTIIISDESIMSEIFINVDRLLIQEMFINLLKNAVNATGLLDNPVLTVSVTKVVDDKSVWVCVEDNGVGMSEDQIKNIQNGFFPKQGRRGMGVRISIIILQAHNSQIEYKSQLNIGTKATVTIPLAAHGVA